MDVWLHVKPELPSVLVVRNTNYNQTLLYFNHMSHYLNVAAVVDNVTCFANVKLQSKDEMNQWFTKDNNNL